MNMPVNKFLFLFYSERINSHLPNKKKNKFSFLNFIKHDKGYLSCINAANRYLHHRLPENGNIVILSKSVVVFLMVFSLLLLFSRLQFKSSILFIFRLKESES
jgi:hypothetical protein